MNIRLLVAQGTLMIGLVVAAAVADGLAGSTYDLTWNTIDGGGGASGGGGFELAATIGQFDAGGPLTGGGFELSGGFWPGIQLTDDCPEDINGDNSVNVADLLAVISSWGACPLPCPPHCSADINDDCAVNVADLLAVISSWGACP